MKNISLTLLFIFGTLYCSHAQTYDVTVRDGGKETYQQRKSRERQNGLNNAMDILNSMQAQAMAQEEADARIRLMKLEEEKKRLEIEAAKKQNGEDKAEGADDDEIPVSRKLFLELFVDSAALNSLTSNSPELKNKAEEIKSQVREKLLELQKQTK